MKQGKDLSTGTNINDGGLFEDIKLGSCPKTFLSTLS